ncbi:MAG: O-antigen ligase family protein [Chthoniobacterales bacterium]
MKQQDFQGHGLTIPFTVFIFLLLACFAGAQIGSSDFSAFLLPLAAIGGVVYVLYLSRFTWQIALLLCNLGLLYRPAGFEVGSTEVTCALGAALIVLTIWKKRISQKNGVLLDRSFSLFRFFLSLWIAYLALHMIYNISNPYRPSEFALKNALKSYFAPLAPALLLWYFSRNPVGLRVGNNALRILAKLTLLGLVFYLGITFYGLIFHHSIFSDADPAFTGTIFIPVINARENPYMLRGLGPGAVLLGATAWCLGRRQSGISWNLGFLLLFLGSLGTLLSGGRATVVTAILLVSMMLVLRRQILALGFMLVVAVLLVAGANLSSGWINRDAPLAVSRPLQWIMITKNQEASESIQSSSRWRGELFHLAITEWRSDPRIFWFGRATYGFGISDYVAQQISGGYEGMKETSLRRGATHNLLSDLLVTYGLVGCLLYYCVILATIRFLWVVYRSRKDSPQVAIPLSLLTLISFVSYLVTASIGGGYYSIEMIWELIVLVAVLYSHQPVKLAPALSMPLNLPSPLSQRFRPRASPARP